MGDPRADLAEVIAQVRAFAELHAEAGTTGLPGGASTWAPLAGSDAEEPVLAAREVDAPASPRPAPPPVARAARPPPPPVSSEGPPAVRLQTLSDVVSSCRRCVLHETRTQTVFARGNPEAEVCFVGEGPGADEDAQGFPFVGKAGQLLDKMIAAMGYARDDVYVCNIVKCRPPGNRKPERDEMNACMPYLHEQLAAVSPKVIVALGGTAAEGLIGAPVAITRTRGQWRLYRGTVPLMLTYHPAYLLRTPEAKRDAWNDLKAVLAKLGKTQA